VYLVINNDIFSSDMANFFFYFNQFIHKRISDTLLVKTVDVSTSRELNEFTFQIMALIGDCNRKSFLSCKAIKVMAALFNKLQEVIEFVDPKPTKVVICKEFNLADETLLKEILDQFGIELERDFK
jgi:hypothetical protein